MVSVSCGSTDHAKFLKDAGWSEREREKNFVGFLVLKLLDHLKLQSFEALIADGRG